MLFSKHIGLIRTIVSLWIVSFTSCTQQAEPVHAGNTEAEAQYDVTEGRSVAEESPKGEQYEEVASFQCDYFGQEPPGNEPVVFAPGIVSVDNADAVGCTFSPDGKEFYFSRRTNGRGNFHADVMFSKREAGGWTDPEVAEFSKEYGAYEPHISPDGKRLYFKAMRPWPASWGKLPR